MSVIVKYMSKPSRCCRCVFERSDSNSETYCGLSLLGVITGTVPPEWCPIIEIPKPHGAIVEVDEADTPVLLDAEG